MHGPSFHEIVSDDFELQGWAVVSNGASHDLSHIHTHAWASGVYYVVEPPIANEPGCHEAGCISVLRKTGRSAQHGWAERLIAPKPGRLVLMPGYFYHHTRPMGVDEERICIAFDVVPAEIAAGVRIRTGVLKRRSFCE